MIYIVLTILGIIASLTVKRTWCPRTQLLYISFIILAGSLTLVTASFFLDGTEGTDKGTPIFNAIPWVETGLYFSMLAGMAAKYCYDWIGEGGKRRKKFDKWQLAKPMFVSPIIFGMIYGTVDQKTSVMLLLIFSFQNGFFWQTILNNPAADKAK